MATSHFDFLAQAKPASLHKLLEKLSMADAAVVLTGVPHGLAIQALAFFPDDKQAALLPAMRDARLVSEQLRQATAQKIRTMLDAARSARDGKAASLPNPAQPPVAKAPVKPVPVALPPVASMPAQPFGMDPSASILTGSVPDDIPEEPAKPPVIPLTPKFSPPHAPSRQNAAPAAQAYQQQPAAQKPTAPGPLPGMKTAARPTASGPAMNFKNGANPYDSAPPAHEPPAAPAQGDESRPPNSGELIGQALSDLGQKIKKAFSPDVKPAPGQEDGGFRTKDPAAGRSTAPGARKKPDPVPPGGGKPVPWVPRAATSSPINGPALPGKPPPIVGDPFESPLAQAGLLDLIGRAQEKFMPKGTAKNPHPEAGRDHSPSKQPALSRRPGAKPGKPGRPEAREGVIGLDKVGFNSTPRVIGPRPRGEELVNDDRLSASGARRMDGKAILAAILRNATPELRETVQEDDPKLFKELRGRMFYFDDLIYTEDTALARVFTAAPAETAALALKFAAPKLRQRVLAAVSPGRARVLKDTPPRAGMDDIESAQKQVLNVALQLQAAGRILIDPRDPDLAL